MPRLHIDTSQILTHAADASGSACQECGPRIALLIGDTAALLAEITWLYRSLIQSRRRSANLEAAIRAALGAQEDADHDPIGYLRDELTPEAGGAYGCP